MTTCLSCGKEVDWDNEKCFAIDYINPDGKPNSAVFFHEDCFIGVAGKEWAIKCGMRVKKNDNK